MVDMSSTIINKGFYGTLKYTSLSRAFNDSYVSFYPFPLDEFFNIISMSKFHVLLK